MNITKEGNIQLNSGSITKGQSPDEIRNVCGLHSSKGEYNNGWSYISYRGLETENDKVNISFRFYRKALKHIDLIPLNIIDSDTDWDSWSESRELILKEKYNKWITSKIGVKRKFSWGKIESIYDPRSGGSGIVMIYK